MGRLEREKRMLRLVPKPEGGGEGADASVQVPAAQVPPLLREVLRQGQAAQGRGEVTIEEQGPIDPPPPPTVEEIEAAIKAREEREARGRRFWAAVDEARRHRVRYIGEMEGRGGAHFRCGSCAQRFEDDGRDGTLAARMHDGMPWREDIERWKIMGARPGEEKIPLMPDPGGPAGAGAGEASTPTEPDGKIVIDASAQPEDSSEDSPTATTASPS